MRFHTGKGLFAFAPFCTALVVSMGVDCCQEPVVFPEPVQGSFAPDEGSELIQAWDFATCEAGWTSSATNGNPVWSCGEPTIGPRAGVEGSGTVLATKINVEIPANMDESIISPTVDLSAEAGGSVFLSVWHWYNFPGAVDGWSSGGGRVEVFSNDQWVPIEPAGGYDGTISAWGKSLNGKQGFTAAGLPRVWRQSYFDVTPYIGPQFKVRFHAVNIVDLNKEGWYIDNVELWRGSVSAHVPSADLGACEPGRSLTFAFNSCDEGFGVLGDKVWQCGVPTRDRGMSQYDGPLTDGPAFDRDDSGLTWGTELSGHLPKGAESALVTPAVNAGGCANGSLKLGFWNWYHFGTGGGGFVQAFDGIGWVDVAPEDGYPGVIGGGMQWRKAYGHDAFVTTNDKPSGWQYQVIDLTPFINNELRVRFVVSADNTATRPGWYVDTVEFVRDILDSVSPLQGTPNEPMCGLATTSLSAADVDPTVKRDPCTEGEPVLDWQSLENEITPNGPVTTHSFDVQHPEGGSLCIVLSNGSPRFSSTSISVDDQVYYANEGFDAQTNILRKVIPASGRASHIEVNLDGEPGSNAEIQVLHLDSEGTKPIFRPDGSATSFSNLTLGYHDEMRYTGEENPRTVKMYDINFDIELPKTVYGTMGIDSAIAYVIQIMDTSTCQQIREIRGWQGYLGEGEKGYERGVAHVHTRWDGLDEAGQPASGQGRYVFRISAYPAFVPTYPSRKDHAIVPYQENYDIPSSMIDIDIWNTVIAVNEGIAAITNQHDTSLNGAVGGEYLSLSIYLPATVHIFEAPPEFFDALEADPRSSYNAHPYGWWPWLHPEPFPYLFDPYDIMQMLNIRGKLSTGAWSEVLDNLLMAPSVPKSAMTVNCACGEDAWGNPICGDFTARIRLPQNEALYRSTAEGLTWAMYYEFSLENKEGFSSDCTTGNHQKQVFGVGSPKVTDVVNKSTSTLGGIVRWDESAQIRGRHLWSLTQTGTPDDLRISICYQDALGNYQPIEQLTSDMAGELFQWWIEPFHSGAKHTFPIHEWPFNTSGGIPVNTDIVVRAVFSDTCDNSANPVDGTVSISGTNKAVLKPPVIDDIVDGITVGDEIHVDIAPGESKTLSGTYLQWYSTAPSGLSRYLIGTLSGLGSSNVLEVSGTNVELHVPATATDGTYPLVRALSDLDSYSSEIQGPPIVVTVDAKANIDSVNPDDEEWRSASLDADYDDFKITFSVDEYLQELADDPGFKIYIGNNLSCAELAADPVNNKEALIEPLSDWPGGGAGDVWFKIPYTVTPGLKTISFCSAELNPEGITKIENFRVLGYVDTTSMTKGAKQTCSGSEGTECNWTCGTDTINAQVVVPYDSDTGAPGITEYYIGGDFLFSQQTEPPLCDGIIINTTSGFDCNNILYCSGVLAVEESYVGLYHRWGEGTDTAWDYSAWTTSDDFVKDTGWVSDFFLMTSKDGLVIYYGAPLAPASDGDDADYNLAGGTFWPDQTEMSEDVTPYTMGEMLAHDQPTSGTLVQDHLTITAPGPYGTVYIEDETDLRHY